MKGIKLSIHPNKNLYYAKLSYKYAKGREMEQALSDLNAGNDSKRSEIVQKGFRLPPTISKLTAERNITGFSNIKLVKEEWKSRFVSKQVLKAYYNLSDKEYKDLRKTYKYGSDLIERLESRLDVILFRLGVTKSLGESHHFIKHGLVYITNSKGYWKSRPVDYSKIYLESGTIIGFNNEKLKSNLALCNQLLINKTINKMCFKDNKYSWLSRIEFSKESLNGSKDSILKIGVLWNKPKFDEVLLPITLNTKKL